MIIKVGLPLRIGREPIKGFQIITLVLRALGLGVIIARTDASATPLGVGLVLLATMSCAGGNLVSRAAGKIDMLAFVVWGSRFAAPPLFGPSLMLNGWPAISRAVTQSGALALAAVPWQSVGNTMLGFGVWGWLWARNPAARITPTALLVPIFGMASAAILLGKALPGWKLVAAGLVPAGDQRPPQPCPVDPNPPAPRAVSSRSSTSAQHACVTGATTSWAMRSPRRMIKSSDPRLIKITLTSPR